MVDIKREEELNSQKDNFYYMHIYMKKYIKYSFFITLMLLTLVMAGCGSEKKEDLGLRSPCLSGY